MGGKASPFAFSVKIPLVPIAVFSFLPDWLRAKRYRGTTIQTSQSWRIAPAESAIAITEISCRFGLQALAILRLVERAAGE
jgi:hypothetical protein